MANEWTSIGFGGGETITVAEPLDEVRQYIQAGIRYRRLLAYEDAKGEIVINPMQVKILQPMDAESDDKS